MVFKIGQAMQVPVMVINPATGAAVIGGVVTYTLYDELDNVHVAAGACVEIGNGAYRTPNITPDAAGTWKVTFNCAAVNFNYSVCFVVGIGLEQDIDDYLDTEVAAIKTVTDTLARSRAQKGTQATTNALVVIGAAITDAIPFIIEAYISLNLMVAGDTFLVVEEIRDQDDATYREYGRTTFYDAQTSPMVWFESKVCQGWRISIQRTSGADRNITYQYFTR